jgi:hypothetical protein
MGLGDYRFKIGRLAVIGVLAYAVQRTASRET